MPYAPELEGQTETAEPAAEAQAASRVDPMQRVRDAARALLDDADADPSDGWFYMRSAAALLRSAVGRRYRG